LRARCDRCRGGQQTHRGLPSMNECRLPAPDGALHVCNINKDPITKPWYRLASEPGETSGASLAPGILTDNPLVAGREFACGSGAECCCAAARVLSVRDSRSDGRGAQNRAPLAVRCNTGRGCGLAEGLSGALRPTVGSAFEMDAVVGEMRRCQATVMIPVASHWRPDTRRLRSLGPHGARRKFPAAGFTARAPRRVVDG
jgi:hypothetical protein